MSKIGRKPVIIPEDVKVVKKGFHVQVEGPKGKLSLRLDPLIRVEIKDKTVAILAQKQSKKAKSLHGLSRSLIFNMVEGVTKGFEKTLELHGTGYRAALEGEDLILNVGFSHPVKIKPVLGIKLKVQEKKIIVSGIDKQLVSQSAANIRAVRKPEIYKGKGIRWLGEVVKLKPGKAAKLGEAGKD